MTKETIEQKVEEIVQKLILDKSFELVDVEYVNEASWYLRVFLDKEGGLEIEDCQMISEQLAKALDEQDFIKERYYLEVSSPGLDRKLRKERDFIKYKNTLVDVKIKKEKKILVGLLGDFDEEFIQIIVDDEINKIERKTISSIRLHLEF